MKRVSRLLLWLLGGVVALACVVLLGVNLYVQSQGTHRRIQQELSQRLNTPLQLRQISVTPWNGLKLTGITIPQEGRLKGNFLQAQSFELRVKFWSLFAERLVIRQVLLVKPEVVWAQNSSGKWRLPELPLEQKGPLTSDRKRDKSPATTPNDKVVAKNSTSPVSPAPGTLNEPAAIEMPAPAFTPEVQRVYLKNGNFTFLDSGGKLIAKFMGLYFNSSFRTATSIQGKAKVEKISLRDRFFIENLDSPLEYDPGALTFSGISAQAAGGAINGHFEMQLQAEDSPFTASVKFHGLEAEKLMTNAGGPSGMIQGHVEGFLEAAGKTADSNALAGHGEIVLRDGKVQQYSLLVALGQILQIDELMQLQLEQAEVRYHISPGIVTIDELLLRSPNVRLTATGTIGFNGKLKLDSRLALNDKIRRQLFSPIRANFQALQDSPGYAAVDFNISGTVDRPKTDLMEKLVGRDLRDLGGVISTLFGHSKKRKQREEAAPSATPVPTPIESPSESPSPGESAPPNETPSPDESPTPEESPSPNDSSLPVSTPPTTPGESTPEPTVTPEPLKYPPPAP